MDNNKKVNNIIHRTTFLIQEIYYLISFFLYITKIKLSKSIYPFIFIINNAITIIVINTSKMQNMFYKILFYRNMKILK